MPVAVTAVDAAALRDGAVTDIRTLDMLVPSLLVSSAAKRNSPSYPGRFGRPDTCVACGGRPCPFALVAGRQGKELAWFGGHPG